MTSRNSERTIRLNRQVSPTLLLSTFRIHLSRKLFHLHLARGFPCPLAFIMLLPHPAFPIFFGPLPKPSYPYLSSYGLSSYSCSMLHFSSRRETLSGKLLSENTMAFARHTLHAILKYCVREDCRHSFAAVFWIFTQSVLLYPFLTISAPFDSMIPNPQTHHS